MQTRLLAHQLQKKKKRAYQTPPGVFGCVGYAFRTSERTWRSSERSASVSDYELSLTGIWVRIAT